MEVKEQTLGERQRGWSCDHATYVCADGATVRSCAEIATKQTCVRGPSFGIWVRRTHQRAVNGIELARDDEERRRRYRVSASRVLLSRDFGEITECLSGVVTVAFPKSVRRVADAAFAELKSLRAAVLNEGLEALGADEAAEESEEDACGVFQRSALRAVALPRTLRRIGHRAFFACDLGRATLPGGLERLGKACLKCCELREVAVPDGVAEIPEAAFDFCEHLRTVAFGENSRLAKIGSDAFAHTALEEFVAPRALREIGAGAFRMCERLRRVVLNKGLEILGKEERAENGGEYPGAFQESAVEEVALPSTLRRLGHNTFSHCGKLARLSLPEGIGKIGDGCFAGSGLEGVVVPDSVVEIGREAFSYCVGLKSVAFGERSRLEKVGVMAFCGSGLEGFVAPPSLRTISSGVFCMCERLKCVTLNEGLETLGTEERRGRGSQYYGVFDESTVEEVRFPSVLRNIQHHSFIGCRGLKKLHLPEGLETLAEYCFRLSQVEAVTMPDSLVEIERGAFDYCGRLRSVTFGPNSRLERIGHNAFRESGLESFTAPSTLRVISQAAFVRCASLKLAVLNEGLEVLGTDEESDSDSDSGVFQDSAVEEVTFPSTLKEIGRGTFAGCSGLKNIKLPDSLETIGRYAFRESRLEGFVAPPSLRTLSQGAFCGCEKLARVVLNEGLEVLGTDEYPADGGSYYGVFEESGVVSVGLPSTLKRIGYGAFQDCGGLRYVGSSEKCGRAGDVGRESCADGRIEVPECLVEICHHAFYKCANLRQLVLEEGSKLEKVGSYAFKETGLEAFVAPDSLREIGAAAFCGCESLTHVELNEGLESVGWFCFSATLLKELKLPERVTASKIDTGVGCDYKTVWALEDQEEIGDMREEGADTEVVVVPASARVIRAEAFSGLRKLRRVVFQPGSQLEMIEREAFRECGLEEIELPRSIKKIGEEAFNGCRHLKRVALEKGGALPEVERRAFAGTPLRSRARASRSALALQRPSGGDE